MKKVRLFAVIGVVAAVMMGGLGPSPSVAQPRAHVYLLRGLMNIFSLGMDTLAEKLQHHGIYATVHNHTEWQALADRAAAAYRAGTEGPIILIGHSLGADAVMEMAAYLGARGVPVALVVPFDGTKSYATPGNVGRLVNLTQRDYAYMRRGPGFHGSLANVDVSSDPNIGHISIDKSPRLHARVVSEVLAVVGGSHHPAAPTAHEHKDPSGVAKPANNGDGVSEPDDSTATPAKPANGASNRSGTVKPLADNGAAAGPRPERSTAGTASGAQ